MKYIKKTLVIALCLAFSLGFMMMSGLSVQKAYAEDYKYTVTIYSGKEGFFNEKDIPENHKISVSASYGDQVTIDVNNGKIIVGSKETDFNLTQLDSDKYYVKGVKVTGHDNGQVDTPTFIVEGDASYSVVYGMKGGMVKYTVYYVDENGAELAEPGEFYGMAGDKPVVSFKYIEGYAPQAYNLGKTLSENEAENVFTFTYTVGTAGTADNGAGGNGAGGNGAGGGPGAGAGAGAGAAGGPGAGAGDGAGANIGDGATPAAGPADYVDLDDGQTPTTDSTDIQDEDKPGTNWPFIGAGAALVALIAVLALIFARRRRSEETEEE